MVKTQANLLAILIALVLIQSLSVVSAQRRKAPKKPATVTAKTYSIAAAQSQLTLTLLQEGVLRKIHPTHHVGVKRFSGRIQLPADETKALVELDAETKSFINIDSDMKDFERTHA